MVARRRPATFARVMPVARLLASLRCGSSPNSGQSSRRPPARATLASGIADGDIAGVEDRVPELVPHPTIASDDAASATVRASRGAIMELFLAESRRRGGAMLRAPPSKRTGACGDGQDPAGGRAGAGLRVGGDG